MKYFILAFKKWNDINGRANLKEFWYYTLFYVIINLVLVGIDTVFINDILISNLEMQPEDFEDGGLLVGLFSLINIIPSLTLTVRRYHDVNKSGWNLLWALTIIGLLYLFILTILKGSKEDNHYGAPSNA